jgi:hypothetical protein
LIVVSLCVVGCGEEEPSGPAYAPFNGRWDGSLTGIHMRVTTTDNDGEIDGTGFVQFGSSTLTITVTGDHDHPDVEFTGRATNFDSFEFRGEFEDANTVHGHVDGSGFTNDFVVLRRF